MGGGRGGGERGRLGEEPGGRGTSQPWGGELRTRGRGKRWWTRGTGTGRRRRELRLLTPPPSPPLPQWLLKALGPQTATARKAGAIGSSAKVLEPACAGDQPVFSSPAHSHMTIM